MPTIGLLSQDAAVKAKIIAADKSVTMILCPTTLLALGFAFAITRPEIITTKPIRIGFNRSEI